MKRLSSGKVDLTIGSALDCFGGSGVMFEDCLRWNRREENDGETGRHRQLAVESVS